MANLAVLIEVQAAVDHPPVPVNQNRQASRVAEEDAVALATRRRVGCCLVDALRLAAMQTNYNPATKTQAWFFRSLVAIAAGGRVVLEQEVFEFIWERNKGERSPGQVECGSG